MKKQLLAAAVAATMTSVAMADISLTGAMKVNYTNTDSQTDANDTNVINHDLDFTLVGKSGDTTVSATFATTSKSGTATVTTTAGSTTVAKDTATSNGNTGGLKTENVILTTKVGDINIKTGSWSGADSLISNGTRSDGKFEASMDLNGVGVLYGDKEGGSEYVKISGNMAGVSLSHEMGNTATGNVDYTDTKVSGSVANVDVAWRAKNTDGANNDMESVQVSTNAGGMTLTYAQAEQEGSGNDMDTDAFFGEYNNINKISGFGVAGSLAGNKVAIKSYEIEATQNAVSDDYTKIIVTRPLASGATFEATYTDKDAASGSSADSKTLDLELAVKF